VLGSAQFVGMDEPSQRNMIGSFIYPYVDLIMKNADKDLSQQQQLALSAKATGMIIEIPSIPQMMMAC